MTEEQKNIVLLGSRYETMNKYIDLSNDDGTIAKGIAEAMQEYAERYHIAQTKKLHQHTVSGRSEQLLALAQYMCEHQNNLDGKTAKDYLQDFLSQ